VIAISAACEVIVMAKPLQPKVITTAASFQTQMTSTETTACTTIIVPSRENPIRACKENVISL
jgi:hypothetical protein